MTSVELTTELNSVEITNQNNTVVLIETPNTVEIINENTSVEVQNTNLTVEVITSENTVVIEQLNNIVEVFSVGVQGPAGDSIEYTALVDDSNYPLTYVGNALPGSLTSQAVWQIRLIDETDAELLVVTFADGDSDFDNVWDNRASLIYS